MRAAATTTMIFSGRIRSNVLKNFDLEPLQGCVLEGYVRAMKETPGTTRWIPSSGTSRTS